LKLEERVRAKTGRKERGNHQIGGGGGCSKNTQIADLAVGCVHIRTKKGKKKRRTKKQKECAKEGERA